MSNFNGTDTGQASAVGVVCNNDIAVIVIRPKSSGYVGDVVGSYSYGWNGY